MEKCGHTINDLEKNENLIGTNCKMMVNYGAIWNNYGSVNGK